MRTVAALILRAVEYRQAIAVRVLNLSTEPLTLNA
jgi:hypothetical protein